MAFIYFCFSFSIFWLDYLLFIAGDVVAVLLMIRWDGGAADEDVADEDLKII